MKNAFEPLRSILDKLLTLTGVLIVLVQVLFMAESRVQGAIVLLGLFLIIIGAWRLGSYLLPERREYFQLRSEVQDFLELVPQLHFHSVAGDDARVRDLREQMHRSVDRMAEVADERGRAD